MSDEPFRHCWSVPLPVKCRITCLRVTLIEPETFCITFDDFVGWAAHHICVSVVACNSDSEILAAVQTEEIVVRTQTKTSS